MECLLECPQDFEVQVLSSKVFYIGYESKYDTNELFITAIIQDLIDVFGDDFKVTFYSFENKHKIMKLELSQFKWLMSFASDVSVLKKKCVACQLDINILFVTLQTRIIHDKIWNVEIKEGIHKINQGLIG